MSVVAVEQARRTARVLPELPQLGHWLMVPLMILLAVVAVGYDVTHDALDTAQELAVDQYVSLHHVTWLNPVATTIAVVLSPPGAVIITVAIAALVWRRRGAWWALAFGGTVMCGWLFAGLIKLAVARPRPAPWTLADPLMPEINNASFPSGHTTFTTALVVGLVMLVATSARSEIRSRWLVAAVLGAGLVVLVAVSRIYMGVHYPSDALCAVPVALAGCCFATGMWNNVIRTAVERLFRRS